MNVTFQSRKILYTFKTQEKKEQRSFVLESAMYYESYQNVDFNPLSPNPTKWSNTLKQFVGNLPTNCLGVLDHFVKLALKGF